MAPSYSLPMTHPLQLRDDLRKNLFNVIGYRTLAGSANRHSTTRMKQGLQHAMLRVLLPVSYDARRRLACVRRRIPFLRSSRQHMHFVAIHKYVLYQTCAAYPNVKIGVC